MDFERNILKAMFLSSLTGGVPFGEFFRWSFVSADMSTKRMYFTLFVCGCLFLSEAFYLFCKKRNLNLVEKLKIPPLAQAVFMGIFLFLCVFFCCFFRQIHLNATIKNKNRHRGKKG